MYLGIEIGGTKLQLGVGRGDGDALVDLRRAEVDVARGAAGILEQIERLGTALTQKHDIQGIGIGFGGPVDARLGKTITSHQVSGWEDIALAAWCEKTFGAPTALANDCDAAALAEAKFGAGQGRGNVFYVTVGTGVGGGWVLDGEVIGGDRPAFAEIGHLRPGLHCDHRESTVESLASGWGIAAAARERFTDEVIHHLDRIGNLRGETAIRQRLKFAAMEDEEYLADLWQRCGGDLAELTCQHVAQAADDNNQLAREILAHATEALGWAIAQVITLLAPEVAVVGGGVSLIGETAFLQPLRDQVERFAFGPLVGSYEIVPAALGELVVVHGALAIAK